MAKAIKVYAGGIHGLVHAAVREDGQVFRRYQEKSRYGYRWGAWRAAEKVDPADLPATLSSGFSTLFPVDGCIYRKFAARLPG